MITKIGEALVKQAATKWKKQLKHLSDADRLRLYNQGYPVLEDDISRNLDRRASAIFDKLDAFETHVSGLTSAEYRRAKKFFQQRIRQAIENGDPIRARIVGNAYKHFVAAPKKDLIRKYRDEPWYNAAIQPEINVLYTKNMYPAKLRSEGSAVLSTGETEMSRQLTRNHEANELLGVHAGLRKLYTNPKITTLAARRNAMSSVRTLEDIENIRGSIKPTDAVIGDLHNIHSLIYKPENVSDYTKARMAEKNPGVVYLLGNDNKLSRVASHYNEGVLRRDEALQKSLPLPKSEGVKDYANLRKLFSEDSWLRRKKGSKELQTADGTMFTLY